ncbi:unnamed protein product [Dovyalis caffra]|uniref:Uncharacterized protein n=1 Tax=Dovyalis caffra TaxID=77055 RepID=A0AAV1SEA0_9ROSI|nr:unnamed protein product [Dovyalis caffra]
MIKEDDMIAPSQSQLFGPKIADTGASVTWGLNHMAREEAFELSTVGPFSLVTKASIFKCRLEISSGLPDIGSRRSSMESSEEFLNAQTRITSGVLHLYAMFANMSSRIIDMKGVMPLPPLTITSLSCLNTKVHRVLQLRPQDDQLKKVMKASGVASATNFLHS